MTNPIAVSDESRRLVEAAVRATALAEDADCYPAEEKRRLIAAESAEAALLAHIASIEKEREHNGRMESVALSSLGRAETTFAKLNTEIAALREERDSERVAASHWLELYTQSLDEVAALHSELQETRKCSCIARHALHEKGCAAIRVDTGKTND